MAARRPSMGFCTAWGVLPCGGVRSGAAMRARRHPLGAAGGSGGGGGGGGWTVRPAVRGRGCPSVRPLAGRALYERGAAPWGPASPPLTSGQACHGGQLSPPGDPPGRRRPRAKAGDNGHSSGGKRRGRGSGVRVAGGSVATKRLVGNEGKAATPADGKMGSKRHNEDKAEGGGQGSNGMADDGDGNVSGTAAADGGPPGEGNTRSGQAPARGVTDGGNTDGQGGAADAHKAPPSRPPTPWEMQPPAIVAELSRHVIGQAAAKRVLAQALRRRVRRQALPTAAEQAAVKPRHVLLVGPTGSGKTELVRQVARLVDAPMTIAAVTTMSQVGYHGRDVEDVVGDLFGPARELVLARRAVAMRSAAVVATASGQVEDALEAALVQELWLRGDTPREQVIKSFRAGELEEQEVKVDVYQEAEQDEFEVRMDNLLKRDPKRKYETVRRKGAVADLRPVLQDAELLRRATSRSVDDEVLSVVENEGIVVLDEIDKLAFTAGGMGGSVSTLGVQRDLLPLLDGTTVRTAHGRVRTDHILFIGAGAFHTAAVTDLLAELQGRLPLRGVLSRLDSGDLARVLRDASSNALRDVVALLATEGIRLVVLEEAVAAMAFAAATLNDQEGDIGARRLYAVVEAVTEELSYNAADNAGQTVTLTAGAVREAMRQWRADRAALPDRHT